MLGITDLPTYLLGTIAIVLLPGPNSLFVLSTGARYGVAPGYRAACGVFLGDTVLMVFSAAGIASLLEAYPPLFMIIKYAGAAYLCYVGLCMLRGVWTRWSRRSSTTPHSRDHEVRATGDPVSGPNFMIDGRGAGPGPGAGAGMSAGAGTGARPVPGPKPFRKALVISLLNPKAILFFVSFFIQFVDPSYPYPAVSFLLLGAIAQVVSAGYLSVLIFAGTLLAVQFRRRRRLSAAMTTGLGALFVGFGVKLATAGL